MDVSRGKVRCHRKERAKADATAEASLRNPQSAMLPTFVERTLRRLAIDGKQKISTGHDQALASSSSYLVDGPAVATVGADMNSRSQQTRADTEDEETG